MKTLGRGLFWPLDFVFPASFWRECGTNEDFTCRSEKSKEGAVHIALSKHLPPTALSRKMD